FLAPLERRVAATTLVAGVYALQPIALAVLVLFTGPLAPFVFVVLYGARRFASIQGVLGLFITLGLAVGPVGLGALYDRLGGYELGFWLVAGASVVAVGAVTWGTRIGRPASER